MTVTAGDLGIMMPTGRVLADDGVLYETVQAAENAASSFIWIGPGTFSEAVTIDTAGLMVLGSGRGTLIDGGTDGDAIDIQAANVLIANLSVQTTAGGGNSFEGVAANSGGGGDSGVISRVWVRDSDNNGIRIEAGNDWIISNCIVENADGLAYSIIVDRCLIIGCVLSGVGNTGAATFADSIIANCIIDNPSDHGVSLGADADNVIVTGNRILGASSNGVNIVSGAADNIVAKNRISGSGSSDISDSSTSTVLSANRTGAAN